MLKPWTIIENSTIIKVTGTKISLCIDCGKERASAIEIPPRNPHQVIIARMFSFRSFFRKKKIAGSHNDTNLIGIRRIAIVNPIIKKLN